jgi:hypothetical protein
VDRTLAVPPAATTDQVTTSRARARPRRSLAPAWRGRAG